MDTQKKLSDKFYEVLSHEGVVAIVSWTPEGAHVANTWNSYLVVTEDERILIPAYGLRKTQKNVTANNQILLTLGTREVLGYKDYQGTGFLVSGTARYFDSGEEYDMMKEKFSFLSRVLEVTITKAKQTL
ncbi:pyridoxamine 5'-phosphate oxidase family protein [Dysgonomonas macrotermitis]|uniref:Pyridoxamine 5'-phosphate oxidase n=1 Tax=Dysgonomonas macrotermitis TaxID=1346286 RepID=A0A1M5FQG4_9BACT|nr:pyridoxamine 5'-phosphate oxidase family protein [Dysgonomonas macrotermitis]SHF93745.1 Pyridoxamine 5'-phosphate oxidase [Dysgonomonas macrotermitis]